MPTHDYSLANQSGASFRTDLNNALAAIASNNSNATSPSTTVAYQWWADTNAGVLKIRNSSNNAWIQLLRLDGTITIADGSASNPSLALRNDLDTGLFSDHDGRLKVASGGVERLKIDGTTTVFNDTGADTDFRIEGSGAANLFYVDAGNDRIGINISTPQNRLHQHTNSSSSNYHSFTNTTTGTTASDGGLVGIDANENLLLWNLENEPIRFGVNNLEKMRIGTNGTLSINNAANGDNTIHIGVTSNDSGIIQKATGNHFSTFTGDSNRTGANNTITRILANWNGTSVAAIALITGDDTSNKDDGEIIFQTSSADNIAERMRIDTAGRVLIGTTTEGESFADVLTIASSSNAGLTIRSGTSNYGSLFFSDGTSGNAEYRGYLQYYHQTDTLIFGAAADERMRIDNNGHILFTDGSSQRVAFGTSGNVKYSGFGRHDGAAQDVGLNFFTTTNAGTNFVNHFRIDHDGGLFGTDTTIASISDSRVKTDITDYTYDLAKFKQFAPKQFNWKNPEYHGEKTNVKGFLAQDLESIDTQWVGSSFIEKEHPDYDLVDKNKNSQNEDVGVAKTSKFGEKDAMYISVINQMISKIETLETKVAALEAA